VSPTGAILAAARKAGRRVLDEPDAKRLLAAFGIAVPAAVRIRPDEPIAPALAGLTPPFALKLVAPEIVHKSDVGGVALALADAAAVEAARAAMLRSPAIAGSQIDGFLVEEMAPPGHELVVGGLVDRAFGPIVMLGLGGVFVEILDDVAFRICPLIRSDARDMLGELRARPVLAGARGGVAADEDAIIDVLLRLGGPDGLLPALADEIVEIDLNPLIVSPKGAVAADARIRLSEAPPTAGVPPTLPAGGPRADPLDYFRPLLMPHAVAVLGASAGGGAPGNNLIRCLRGYGFPGAIYPIHPAAETIEGLRAWRSFGDLPAPVDYAFVAVAAPQVPALLRSAAGRVRFAQIMSSGFAEAEGGGPLEAELAAAARDGGMRLIGPNCLGTFSPRGRMTFIDGMAEAVGTVGLLSQSGGLAMDVMRRGQRRGLGFSGVVTIGNCADLGAADFVEFFLADPQTRVIGLYLEDAADARRLFDLLRTARASKPVVLLKGGRTRQGQRAAVSHTGALASDDRVWVGFARQTGTALVENLDEFIDVLLGFQLLAPREDGATERVVLFGNGGGSSVLATDYFARRGLEVAPFGEAAATALRALALPAGSSIANPIDVPANILRHENGAVAGQVLDAVRGEADALVMHLNMPVILSYRQTDMLGNLMRAALRAGGGSHLVLVLRSDGEPEIEAKKQEYRLQAIAAGIPVYDELPAAASALAALARLERFRLAPASG